MRKNLQGILVERLRDLPGEIGPSEAYSDDVRWAVRLVRDFFSPVFGVSERHHMGVRVHDSGSLPANTVAVCHRFPYLLITNRGK